MRSLRPTLGDSPRGSTLRQRRPAWSRVVKWCTDHLNFYRMRRRNGAPVRPEEIRRVSSPVIWGKGGLEPNVELAEDGKDVNAQKGELSNGELVERPLTPTQDIPDHPSPTHRGVQFPPTDGTPIPRHRHSTRRDTSSLSHIHGVSRANSPQLLPVRPPADLTLHRSRTLTRTHTFGPHSDAGNFGGFPNPISLATSLLFARRNTMPVPRTTTFASTHITGGERRPTDKLISYLTFDAEVGRNSNFRKLTMEQEDELGGVEYRALSLLLRVVVGYWLGMQLLAVLILAPWISTSGTFKPILNNPGTLVVNPTWFVFFQVFSAFSNDGLSLDDANMTNFQTAYLLQVIMGLLILGGNTGYPIFLRIIIQTWFLAFVLAALDCTDWFAFLILDIGNPQIDSIPIGTRVINGLFQALSVRSGGFAIVNLSTIAPALQFLYVVMM
ncbi:Trk/Ktr/HKT type cation transporter, partial [Phenoliferia sp. Uapishka_3]